MGLENILAAIDAEIERLQSVRDLLAETTTKTSANAPVATRKRRKLSPAARKRIADAQRKRRAKQRAAK
jgi:hypothetical protein